MFVWLGILKRRILNPPALGVPKLKWPTKFCIYGNISVVKMLAEDVNTFHFTGRFLCPLKASGNLFSVCFRK